MRRKKNCSALNFQIEPKHYEKHNFLIYCNDTLVSMLQYVDRKKLSSIHIEFRSDADFKSFQQLNKESDDWQEWLFLNGYGKFLNEAFYRHTFFSLVGDFCHYMLESFNCAAKMNVAVSYALLRKPLKDTLGCIEWLYINRDEMMNILQNGKPEELEITKDKAQAHSSTLEQIYDKNNYFDFRYNKSAANSLEHIWNNASHLVTSKYKLSKTEQGNLNFVFADEEILRQYSDYYYLVVPAIMSYATTLICEMFEKIAPLNAYTLGMNGLNRMLRILTLCDMVPLRDMKQLYDGLNLPIVCPRCGLKMKMTDKRMYNFLYLNKCTCWRCRKTIETGRYIFEWETVNFTFDT